MRFGKGWGGLCEIERDLERLEVVGRGRERLSETG